MATTLEDAVKSAVETEVKTETSQTPTETKETKTETTETKQPTAEETARQEKIDRALRLYETLNDNDLGPALITQLAKNAGILGHQEGKTEKQITKSVVEVLRESLGTEYEFLADKLAGGIDTVVKQIVQEQVAPLRQSNQEAIERMVKAETDAVFDKFQSAHKDFKENESAMLELSKKLPYTGDYPMDEYLENLYKIVTTDKKEAKVIKQTVDKINKNAQEIRDSSTEVQETRVAKGSKLPSLNEAVAAAFRGEKLA